VVVAATGAAVAVAAAAAGKPTLPAER